MDDEYVMEPKMDGIWGAMHLKDGGYQIWSRTGQLKQEGECISPLSSNEMCILGEFMYGSNWAKKHDKVGQFFAFDMVQWDGDWDFCEKPLNTRRDLLSATLESLPNCFPDFVELNQQWPTINIDGIWKDLVEKRGYEGLMIKNINEPYSIETEWIKVKYRTDIDYVCMGFSDGGKNTKYEDTVGSIVGGLYNTDKELVDVCHVGGLTVDQRDIFNKNRDYFKGKVFTAKGFNIFDSGAIRHGKFKNFRTDKYPFDCNYSQVPSDAEFMP
jgi:ATP-dependent DNA ligase